MKIITIPVTPFMQNCRIIVCEQTQQAVVVDPGGDAEKINASLKQHNLSLAAIWLTHGHLDHVGAAHNLREQHKVKMIGPHENERFWFDNLPMQATMFGFKPINSFYPDEWLAHGDSIKVGQLEFKVLHCPGHAPGHVVFYQQAHNTVIVGDVIFKGSIGRTDFPKGDSKQLIDSIVQHIMTLPPNTAILSGHGDNTHVAHEQATNPFVSGQFG